MVVVGFGALVAWDNHETPHSVLPPRLQRANDLQPNTYNLNLYPFSLPQRVIQFVYCQLCVAVGLRQQLHEFTANYSPCGVLLRRLQRLFVADAEAYHARVTQVHGIDALEILLFRLVKRFLRPCGAGGTYHIDETVRMLVNEPYALF